MLNQNADETIVHLEFLVATKSAKNEDWLALIQDYDRLSKRINKFTEWVEDNLENLKERKTSKELLTLMTILI